MNDHMSKSTCKTPYKKHKLQHKLKGLYCFVFSTDALLAVFVLLATIASISFYSARLYPSSLSEVTLQLKANDMLIVLDKLGYLAHMDRQAIESFVNGTLEPGIGWELNAEYYNYTGGKNGSFVLDKTLTAGSGGSMSESVATTNRVFIVSDNTSVIYYGRAILKTWVK